MRRSVLVPALGVVTPAGADPGFVELGRLPGDNGSRPAAMNDAGEVVGESMAATSRRAVRWSRDGKITRLPDLGGGESTVRWNDEQLVVLPKKPGGAASATLVNRSGLTAGLVHENGYPQAVRWR